MGDRPLNVLASELESTSFGIICLTQRNKLTPWITFEAGALSKVVDASKVIPLLLDLKVSDLTGPLSQFQAVDAGDEAQIFKLVKSISEASPPPPISEDRLRRTFDAFWPTLQEKITELRQEDNEDGHENLRSDRDILEELLDLARRSDRGVVNVIGREIARGSVQGESDSRDVTSLSPNVRRQRVMDILKNQRIPVEYNMSDDELQVKFAQKITRKSAKLSADYTKLREMLNDLASSYSVPIYLDAGPFGSEVFPPF